MSLPFTATAQVPSDVNTAGREDYPGRSTSLDSLQSILNLEDVSIGTEDWRQQSN